AQEICPKQWEELGPTLAIVLETGQSFSAKDRPFNIVRGGRHEICYFDIAFMAIREPDGAPGGVLSVVTDTTEQVRARKHQAFLLRLENRIRASDNAHEILTAACEVLGRELGATVCTFAEIDEEART